MIILSEEELSRVYTINLSKVWLAPRIRRTKRAINMIKEFAQRHMKSDDVKIDQSLNKVMWERGIRNPPRRIRVKMVKDEDDVVTVSLYSEEIKEEEVVEEKPKVEVAAPTAMTESITESVEEVGAVPEEKVEVKEPEKVVEEPKKEEKKIEKPKKKEKEEEPEKIELNEEELAEILAEEAEGLEIREDKEKPKGKKSKKESEE